MVKTRRVLLVPIWMALVASALLLGLLLRAAPVDSPSWTTPQMMYAQPSTVPMTRAEGASAAISVSNSPSTPPAAASSCPAKPGSGLPCAVQP